MSRPSLWRVLLAGPALVPPVFATQLAGNPRVRLFVFLPDQEVRDGAEERLAAIPPAGEGASPGPPPITLLEEGGDEEVDILLVDLGQLDQDDESFRKMFDSAKAVGLLARSPAARITLEEFREVPAERCFGLRMVQGERGYGLEIVRLPGSTAETLDLASRWAQDVAPFHVTLEYDARGGMLERVRVPLETEAWRLVRESGIPPALVEHLSRAVFGSEWGVFARVLREGPSRRGEVARLMAAVNPGDSRFRVVADAFPPDRPGSLWRDLAKGPGSAAAAGGEEAPKAVLIAGSPHLAKAWSETLYESSGGRVRAHTLAMWDSEGFEDADLKAVGRHGPYDLVLECLLSPVEDRLRLIDFLQPYFAEGGQLWAHTLNAASTIAVQVVPQDLCAVGFGGLPPLWDIPAVELMKPSSSDTADLARAAAAAGHLGLHPFEVADEPGGVSARLLATLINATAYVVREGIVASPAEADQAVKDALGLPASPFALADRVGLDVMEAVIVGLEVFLGEDRYRVCPDITMRIEAGAVGQVTGSGYYLP